MGKQINRCVIIGAAPFEDAALLGSRLRDEDVIYVADGGQRLLEAIGRQPTLVIGDFDSSPMPQDAVERVVLPVRKDDTDVMAALRLALERGYREFLLLGCLGGRLDHTIANLFALRFLLEHGAVGCLADERHEVRLLPCGTYTIDAEKEGYLSLFPYGGDVEGLTVSEAQYDVTDIHLDTRFPLGVSNGFLGKPVNISWKSGFMLLILAKEA